jgi:hypothetical protein
MLIRQIAPEYSKNDMSVVEYRISKAILLLKGRDDI